MGAGGRLAATMTERGAADRDPRVRRGTRPDPAQELDLRARLATGVGALTVAATCVLAFFGLVGLCAVRSGAAAVWPDSLWTMGACEAELAGMGALDVARVWLDGQWWRVATAGLLHGSWVHLILNIWSLWVVGWWVERAWGTARLLVLFVAGSLGGCLASLAWAEAPVVVGASAGILAIAGALWVGRSFGDASVRARLEPISGRALGIMIAALVGLGFVVPVIAQAGHLGGLGVGLCLGLGWARPGRWRRAAAFFGVALVLFGLAWTARAPAWRPAYHEFIGYELLERGESRRALVELEAALAHQPNDPALANAVAYAMAKAGVKLERAAGLVEEALEAEPDNPDFVDTKGWILCRQGRTEEGLEVLRQASRLSDGAVKEIEAHLSECAEAAPHGG